MCVEHEKMLALLPHMTYELYSMQIKSSQLFLIDCCSSYFNKHCMCNPNTVLNMHTKQTIKMPLTYYKQIIKHLSVYTNTNKKNSMAYEQFGIKAFSYAFNVFSAQ